MTKFSFEFTLTFHYQTIAITLEQFDVARKDPLYLSAVNSLRLKLLFHMLHKLVSRQRLRQSSHAIDLRLVQI